jgi:NAD(P)-dependent dehydrogenase (short-subunit alcohol dehydrogenase family)
LPSLLDRSRYGKTEDIAAPCIFLASRAGSWMTGEIYAASGGRALGVYGASPGFDVPPITFGGKL